MVMVDQYGRWQLFASSCGRTIYQDGYGGSIWPVATLRLKLWKDHIPRWLWWINMAGGNSSPQVVDKTIYQDYYGGSIWPVATLRLKLWTNPYTKMVMVDQYGRWQVFTSSCGQDHIPRWLWWINMAGGNSTPQAVNRTLDKDGYGG